MKRGLVVALIAAAGCAGLAILLSSVPAVAGDGNVAAAGAALLPVGMPDDKYTYVGSKTCKKCHISQHKSWAKTKMGMTFEVLKPGQALELKKKNGIDPQKDFTKDEKCLKCHTVGFGQPGGYAIPDPADKKAVRKAKKFEGVGCEMCHGPGSEYVKVHKEILKSKRKYKVEELYAVGLRKIDKEVCLTCHNEESPTIGKDYVFDYEARKKKGIHEHKPLKQRE